MTKQPITRRGVFLCFLAFTLLSFFSYQSTCVFAQDNDKAELEVIASVPQGEQPEVPRSEKEVQVAVAPSPEKRAEGVVVPPEEGMVLLPAEVKLEAPAESAAPAAAQAPVVTPQAVEEPAIPAAAPETPAPTLEAKPQAAEMIAVAPIPPPAPPAAQVKPEIRDALLALFRDQFYVPESIKTRYNLFDYRDFVMQETSNVYWNSNMGVVTHFEPTLIQAKLLKDVASQEEAQAYIDAHVKTKQYRSLDIPELAFDLGDGRTANRYWVGQTAFNSIDEAKRAVDQFAVEVEKQNMTFTAFVNDLKEKGVPMEEPEEVILGEDEETEGATYTNIEETIAMVAWQKADLMRFSGKAADEPWFLWQSVMETTWRSTNFSRHNNDSLVGYFGNRVRVRGVKMPFGSSMDPTLEAVYSYTSNGVDFNNVLDMSFGAEYRPFRGIKKLNKYWFTSWIQNIRGHVDYWQRFAIKDPIPYAPDDDWRAGIDIFKEWGIDIPEEGKPDLFWGEYYGDYGFRKTNFSGLAYENGYNSFLSVTRFTGGIKWPIIPLPKNQWIDRITVMPYGGWEWTNNNHLGKVFYENQYYSFVGVRIMPFRDKRYERREWIYKMKLFFEYRGLGHLQHTKARPDVSDPAYDIGNDFVFGVNISSNRF